MLVELFDQVVARSIPDAKSEGSQKNDPGELQACQKNPQSKPTLDHDALESAQTQRGGDI